MKLIEEQPDRVQFFVPGLPRPGGSKKFVGMRGGRAIIVDDSGAEGAKWRRSVAACARAEYSGPLLDGPLCAIVKFFVPRPKHHYRIGKRGDEVRPSAPPRPITRPDTTKLWRSAEDALTRILWHDDSQIVSQMVNKYYADKHAAGALISIIPLSGLYED